MSESESVVTGDAPASAPGLSAPAVLHGHGGQSGALLDLLGAAAPPLDDAAHEELDWGSIHDEDGAFGQIVAASGDLEEGELDLEDRVKADEGNGLAGLEAGVLRSMSASASGKVEEGGLLLDGRAAAERGCGALLGAAEQVMGGCAARDGPCAAGEVDLPSSGRWDLCNGAIDDNSGAGFTIDAERLDLGAGGGASAPKGKLEDGGPACPDEAQAAGSGQLGADGDRSCCPGAQDFTSMAGTSSDPASALANGMDKVLHPTHPSRIPASELYRPEAPNIPIRAAGGRMSYCDAVRRKPNRPRTAIARSNANLLWHATRNDTAGRMKPTPLDIKTMQI